MILRIISIYDRPTSSHRLILDKHVVFDHDDVPVLRNYEMNVNEFGILQQQIVSRAVRSS